MLRDTRELFLELKQQQEMHNCSVSQEDYNRIMPKIEMLQQLAAIERAVYAVYDMHKHNYLLQSEEQKKLFGIGGGNENAIDAQMHYQNIHPDDLPFVLDTDIRAYRFYSALPTEEKRNYKLIYDFRTRNVDGLYVRYMHQSTVLELDKSGRSWLTLVVSHILSDRNVNELPRRHMLHVPSGKLQSFSTDEGRPATLLMTKREKEILSMIASGYDSINISEKLNISVNTVNNHRQNILRKTRTENTTQAVLYSKRLGFI